MKDFITLCNDIVNGTSYRSNSASANRNQRKDTNKHTLSSGISKKFFHERRYGEVRGRPRSVFLLMMIGVFGIAAGCLVLFVNPYDVLFKLKIILSDGGEIFELWRNPPVELYLRVHLFNVTNREAFLAGKEKLRVQEVGPYVYREHMEHTNISFNANGTMTSVPIHPLKWVPEMSNGTEDDILILPNIALLSFANVMLGKSYFTQMAVNLLIRQTDTRPLVEMTAKEFMFGYKSALVTLGHNILPSWIIFDKLGLIDRMYDFEGDISTVYTGEIDIGKTGLLATYNRSPKLPQWEAPCGLVKDASDGTKFPSFIKPNDTLLFFRKSLCRAVPVVRSEQNETYRFGLRGYEYTFIENALDNGEFNKDNKCFCRKGRCLPRGLIDVTDCYYGFPIALSYPHFYQSDPRLLEEVEGSHPDPEKHKTYFIVQPETGLPLEVAVRMQINMALEDVSPISRVGKFKNMVLPLLWTEIRMYGLPPTLVQLFAMYINILPMVQDVAIYLLFTGGAAFVLVAIIKLLRTNPEEDLENYKTNFQTQKISPDLFDKDNQKKSPLFNSKDVISDILDEGKQVIFGKKTQKPKYETVYKDTVRRKSSLVNIFSFLRRKDSKQNSRLKIKKQKTKEELYDIKKSKGDKKETKPLRLSTDSEAESNSEKKHISPFYSEENRNFSETEEKLTKFLSGDQREDSSNESTESTDSNSKGDDIDYEIDVSMLDTVKEEVV